MKGSDGDLDIEEACESLPLRDADSTGKAGEEKPDRGLPVRRPGAEHGGDVSGEKRPGLETGGEKSSWGPWLSGAAIRLGGTSSVCEDRE